MQADPEPRLGGRTGVGIEFGMVDVVHDISDDFYRAIPTVKVKLVSPWANLGTGLEAFDVHFKIPANKELAPHFG